MPEVYGNVYIGIAEIYEELSISEKKQLTEWLINDKDVDREDKDILNKSPIDEEFEASLRKLARLRPALTQDEEQLIKNLASKL